MTCFNIVMISPGFLLVTCLIIYEIIYNKYETKYKS